MSTPIWKQLQQTLLERIEVGALGPGARLPSERALCREYSVSQITVRRALRELAQAGRIERRQGVGTFVADSRRHFGPETRARYAPSVLDVGLVFNNDRAQTPAALAPFYLSLFSHLQAELATRGGSLHWLSFARAEEGLASLLSAGSEARLGSIALVGMFPERVIQSAPTVGIPIVHVDDAPPVSALDAVVLDHVGGARQAVEFLYALGHRRFGMIRGLKDDPDRAGHLVESSGSRERYAGFAKAVAALGIESDPGWELFGELGGYEWVPNLESVLAGARAPTALLLADPHFVPETVRAAERLGRAVPESLSVVSFGVAASVPGFRPRPAMVTFDPAVFAAAVVDRLEARASGRNDGRVTRRIPMRLDPGESIGPAPGSADGRWSG